MLIDLPKGLAARQAELRSESPEADAPIPVSQGEIPDFLAAALERTDD